MMQVVTEGTEAATHTGHLALFGQDYLCCDYRRGPMEASGVGFQLEPGDVALRFNFATVDCNGLILDRRAGRIRAESVELTKSLNQIQVPEPVQLFFRAATEHRGVLVLRGDDLSPHVTDSDPGSLNSHGEVLEVRPTVGGRAALRTAHFLNSIIRSSHRVLEGHPINQARRRRDEPPANVILTRGAGTSQRYVNLPQKLGLKIACISGEATVVGLARLSGMDTFNNARMTANLDTDLDEKAAMVRQRLEDYDLVYLHLKGCDIAGHDRSPRAKLEFIERTDAMLGSLIAQVTDRYRLYVALLGDHCTLSETGDHSDDPVPVSLSGEGISPDSVDCYSERCCAHGGLGLHPPSRLMSQLFDKLVRIPTPSQPQALQR